MARTWLSPDGKISKLVIKEGNWGIKPSELSECDIIITNCPIELENYKDSVIIIGDLDSDLGRILDICVKTMNEKEISTFTIVENKLTFTVELLGFVFKGFIYEWSAREKFNIALNHKEKGVELFKLNQNRDAIHRFAKALKILLSIPIDVQEIPDSIDGVTLIDLNLLKANLYNNMASCYLKNKLWLKVIDLCMKVFSYDRDNIKAHYKIGIAYFNDKNYEKAKESFEFVLQKESCNKAAIEHLNLVKNELKRADVKFNFIVKKMFQ